MARTQTLIWTALPSGYRTDKVTGKQYLRLSVFLSPRLETTAPMGSLGEFPDFESLRGTKNWAMSVNGITWKVETWTPGTTTPTLAKYTAVKTSPAAETDLWDSFFGPEMPTKQFSFKNFSSVAVKTFSTASVFAMLKKEYATIASLPSRAYARPTIANIINLPGVVNPPLVSVLPTQLARSSGVTALAGASAAATQHPEFTAFEEFHTPYAVPVGFVPPTIPPMDFHKALSALANYPALMRRLGLVLDLEIEFKTAMSKMQRIRVVPTWPDGRTARGTFLTAEDQVQVAHIDALHWTACEVKFTTTLPAKVNRFQAKSREGKVKDGYLVVRSITSPSADPVRLQNIDTDLAAQRMMATAVSAASLLNRAVNQAVQKSAGASASETGKAKALAVEAVASTEKMALPPLGQPMIRMSMVDCAARVKAQMTRAAAMNAKLVSGLEADNVNYYEDVTRGYRVDVWDSVTRQWHRLCGRVGTYAIGKAPIMWGADPAKQDEGWVQLGGVSAPTDVLTDEPPTEMRVHEAVFDWSGWSLAVPRPGNALSEPDGDGVTTPTRTFPDPETGSPTDIGHFLHPDLPLDVRWAVPAGDLPRLRFGTTYRFRARAVDLAGNSLSFSKGSTTADPGGTGDSSPYVTRAITHKRFDPVKPPTVVPVDEPKPSESPHVLVVRSYHRPSDNVVVTENTARHITPPRTSVTMAEAQWGLDSATTGKPMDKALWTELCARDAWDAPMAVPVGKTQPEVKPQATFPSPVPYLPDRYARGVAFKRLPGVASTLSTRTISTSARLSGVRIPLSSTSSTTVASFRVSFEKSGNPWYQRVPLKFDVRGIEATDARLSKHDLPALPVWSETNRILRVELPKADEYGVDMSSYMNANDLKVMGVHQWSMEKFVPTLTSIKTLPMVTASASASAPASNIVPVSPSSSLSTSANAVISASLIGQNWMLCPPQRLTLVHAVDQPMIKPAFTSRAHMERKPGETHATLVDWMPIHGKSTVKMDVNATWKEPVDDPAAGAPKWGITAVSKSASVFSLTVPRGQTTILNCGQSLPTMKNVAWGVIPSTSMLVNRSGVDTKPQRHFFGDTKHKVVSYKATYASRYEKYFADIEGLTFKLDSSVKKLHVPSSARPAPPVLDYIVPTFGWNRTTGASARYGGGLRVYLDRPWFSSGEGELLGVVLYQPAPYSAGFTNLEPYVTRWGNDPLWTSNVLPASLPSYSHFTKRVRWGRDLHLREWSSNHVIAVGHSVNYDETTGRWFCDITIDQGKAYFPFVKLALVRYQPYSLPGYEISSVVKADFVQLAPSRWATATSVLTRAGRSITVALTGQTYYTSASNAAPSVRVQLQKRSAGKEQDLGWQTIQMRYSDKLYTDLYMVKQPRTVAQILTGDTRSTWKRTFYLGEEQEEGASYRVVVKESEAHKSYTGTTTSELAYRLVYADAVPLSF